MLTWEGRGSSGFVSTSAERGPRRGQNGGKLPPKSPKLTGIYPTVTRSGVSEGGDAPKAAPAPPKFGLRGLAARREPRSSGRSEGDAGILGIISPLLLLLFFPSSSDLHPPGLPNPHK